MIKKSLVALTLCIGILPAFGEPQNLIDTHAHFQSLPRRDIPGSTQGALAAMERWNITRSILMPPPFPQRYGDVFYDIEDLLPVAAAHPGRFAVMGGSSLNVLIHGTAPAAVDDAVRSAFRKRAEEIADKGAVGFGEIAVHHVSIPAMGPQHAYENVPTDHPLLLLLADVAAERNLPIDVHFDLVPNTMPLPPVLRSNAANPGELHENMSGFARLLDHNPKTRFVWSHVGFEPLLTRDPAVVRQMLDAHPNLYMSFRVNRGGRPPGAALNPEGQLKGGWNALIRDFPDRFMLGSDAFYAREGIVRGSSEDGMNNLRALVEQLPPELGARLARDNAAQLYRLK